LPIDYTTAAHTSAANTVCQPTNTTTDARTNTRTNTSTDASTADATALRNDIARPNRRPVARVDTFSSWFNVKLLLFYCYIFDSFLQFIIHHEFFFFFFFVATILKFISSAGGPTPQSLPIFDNVPMTVTDNNSPTDAT
jgi:hypothetical protein